MATTVGAGPPPHPPLRPLDFPPGAVFANRYTIIERAGQGGMGVVYKAIDNALEHVLALKLMRPDLAQRPSFIDSFKGEVRLARQIAHPNVCRIHDLGESHDILYLSMEWIQGETLRQLLNHAGLLDPDRALAIAERILHALDAAHAKGIVHRDLKPENVMIDDHGSIFVMDFGLAVQSLPGEEPGGGSAAGTPAYMAPEQRRGEPADARTDLYALGLILAEMLSGRMPDPAGTNGPAVLPTAVRREVGPLLDRLLAEDREERFGSAQEANEELRRIRPQISTPLDGPVKPPRRPGRAARILAWAGGGAIVASAVFAWALFRSSAPAGGAGAGAASSQAASPAADSRSKIGATNLGPGQAYFERGMDLLSRESDNVQGVDDALRMFNRSVDRDPGFAPAWAGLGMAYWIRYALSSDDAFKTRGEESIKRAAEIAPDLPETWFARAIASAVSGNYLAADAALKRVVVDRPDVGFAWAYLGAARSQLDDYAGAEAATKTAIGLDPNNGMYFVMLGNVHERFNDYHAATEAYNRAIELRPDSRWAWNNLGAAFLRMQMPERAADMFSRALRIEDSATGRSNLGTAYFFQGKYDLAIENYRAAAQKEPKSAVHGGNLGDALQAAGRRREAVDAYRLAAAAAKAEVKERPDAPLAHERLALYCARSGDTKCAIEHAAIADRLRPRNTEILLTNAVVRVIFGREEEGFDWLERAVKIGLPKAEIQNEPAFAPFRENPRYKQILALAN